MLESLAQDVSLLRASQVEAASRQKKKERSKAFSRGYKALSRLIIFGLCVVGLSLLCRPNSEDNESAQQDTMAESAAVGLSAEQVRQRDAEVREMIATGAAYSVSVDLNQVRMSPAVWDLMDLTAKQGIVLYFSQYFKAKGSTGRVTILSDRNDEELGSYSVWSGIKITR